MSSPEKSGLFLFSYRFAIVICYGYDIIILWVQYIYKAIQI